MNRFYRLFIALTLGALVSVPAFAIDDPSYRNVIKLQTVGQTQGEAVRVIKLVRYVSSDDNATSLVSGDAVSYSLLAASDDGVSVARVITTADGAFAGIVCMTIQTGDSTGTSAYDDVGRRNWGWVTVNGYAIASSGAGGTNNHAAGDPFYTSRTEGGVATLESVSVSGDNAAVATANANYLRQWKASSNVGGFFMDAADGSATTWEVYVENM